MFLKKEKLRYINNTRVIIELKNNQGALLQQLHTNVKCFFRVKVLFFIEYVSLRSLIRVNFNELKTMIGWGANHHGQLGLGSNDDSSSEVVRTPTLIPKGLPADIVSVAAGWRHTLFLSSSGAVFSCGANDFGQLGQSSSQEYRWKYLSI